MIAAVILAISLHNSFFQIKEDEFGETITQNLSKTVDKSCNIQDIQIRKYLDLNLRRIVVYSFPAANGDEIIGAANFYKGLNKKYSVGEIYCQKKLVYLFVVKDFASQYLIIAGKNYQGCINSIEVIGKDGSSYKEDISKENYFIFNENVNVLGSYRMLDKEGNQIPLSLFDNNVE